MSPVLNYKLFYTSYTDYIKPQNRKHLVKCLIYRPDELMTTKESRLNSIIGVTLKEAKYFISVVYHQALSNLPVTPRKKKFHLKSTNGYKHGNHLLPCRAIIVAVEEGLKNLVGNSKIFHVMILFTFGQNG